MPSWCNISWPREQCRVRMTGLCVGWYRNLTTGTAGRTRQLRIRPLAATPMRLVAAPLIGIPTHPRRAHTAISGGHRFVESRRAVCPSGGHKLRSPGIGLVTNTTQGLTNPPSPLGSVFGTHQAPRGCQGRARARRYWLRALENQRADHSSGWLVR